MLYFQSQDEIKNILPFLNQFFIDDFDSSDVKEYFSIIVYLYANNKLGQLNFPFELIKREHPDFSILCYERSQSKGIEHTLSTLQDYKMAESELQKLPEGSKLEPDYYSPFKKLPKEEINSGIRQPTERLTGQGYSGDRPEIEWAEIIKNTMHTKTILFNKNHFKKFATNELIIQGDSPVEFFIDLEVALKYLEPNIKGYLSYAYEKRFDKIHIISKNSFVYDILSRSEIVRFSKDVLFS